MIQVIAIEERTFLVQDYSSGTDFVWGKRIGEQKDQGVGHLGISHTFEAQIVGRKPSASPSCLLSHGVSITHLTELL